MRLIDADSLCNDLMKRWDIADKEKENLIRAVMADVVTPIVASQPTIDAVPVVRCKDCKHYQFVDSRAFGFPVKRCEWAGFEDVEDSDYCSRAERREK